MYVPNYQIPLWEDEGEKDPIYAVLNFPEETNTGAGNDEEPFYYLLEEVVPNNKGIDDNNFAEDPSKPQPNKDPIYAKVTRKKQLVDTLLDMSDLINSRENNGNSEDASVLGPYVKGADEEGRPETSAGKPVYFTLEECFSDTFRRCNNDLDCNNAPIYRILEGPDRYRAICTEALFYYSPNRSECDDENNNNSKFTIGQVFDELEDRYLNRNEETATTPPERTGVNRCSERQDESDSGGTNGPVYNFLEDVCLRGPPIALSHHGGPVYFNLKRLKSNHAKATRIRSRLEEAPEDNVVEEQYLKGTEGDDWTEEEPVFYTLEKLCSDTFKRESSDCLGTTIEQALEELEERYLRRNEESGDSSPERTSVPSEIHCLDEDKDTSASKDANEPNNPPKYRAKPIRKGPVYLTLNQLRANLSNSKVTGSGSKLEDEQVYKAEEETYLKDAKENDHSGVLGEPIFFTLNKLCPDSLKRYRSEGQGTTIEQVFDELEERYLKRNEDAGITSTERPSLQPEGHSLDKEKDESNSQDSNEPIHNFFEDVRTESPPKYRAKPIREGPVYITLNRLRANLSNSKATGVGSKLEDERVFNLEEENYLKDAKENHQSGAPDEPILFTLNKLCPDSLKRYRGDGQGTTIEQVFDELEKRYFKRNEEAGITSSERSSLPSERRSLDTEKDVSDSKDSNEPIHNFFEDVRTENPPKYRAKPIREGPVYLTLKRLRANLSNSKATVIGSKLEDEHLHDVEEENYLKDSKEKDQSEALYEPIFFTLNKLCPDSLKRYRSDGQGTTIQQVFDELEERYLKRNEDAGITCTGRPSLQPEGHYLDKEKDESDSKDSNEPMHNFFEDVGTENPPKYRAKPIREGPIYLTLNRLRANLSNSKATGISSKLEDEQVHNVEEENYLKDDEEKDQSGAFDERIFFTLNKLCPDSLKRYRSDGQGTTIEQVFDELEERYLKTNDEARITSSERPSQQPEGPSLDKEKDNIVSKDSNEPIHNSLEEVCTVNPPKYKAKPIREGPVYLTLNRLRANLSNSKATGTGSKLEDEHVHDVEEQNYLKDSKEKDQSEALYEPIFFTLNKLCPDSLKRYRSDGQGTTIEQVFDELEERYLRRNEDAWITSTERPSLQPEGHSLDKEKDESDSKDSNEPMHNFFEDVGTENPPKYRAKPIREGPIYLTLNRLRANLSNSKATGISSKLEDEQVHNVEEENYLKDDEEKDQSGAFDERIFFTLNKLCPDSLKRYRSDGQGTTIEQVFDELEERYLKTNDEARITSSERPGQQPDGLSLDKEKDNIGSKDSKEPIHNSLEEVCTVNPPKYKAKPIREGPVYLTLKSLRANLSNSKATGIGSKLEDEQVHDVEEENNRKDSKENNPSEALNEPIFFTLNKLCPDSLKRYRSDGQGTKIEQVFDELQERYLRRNEDAGITSTERPSLQPEGHALDKEKDVSDSKDSNEPIHNFFEDVRTENPPKYRAKPIREGPIYLTFKRRRANLSNSKATRVGSKLEGEQVHNVEEEDSLKQDQSEALYEPIFFTLNKLCPDSLKRYRSDGQGTAIEQVFDELEERYLKRNEEPGTTALGRPNLTSETHCLGAIDKSESEDTKEQMHDHLEEACIANHPKFRAKPIREGPVYLTLKQLGANQSKVVQTGSKLDDDTHPRALDEPICFTLNKLCPDSLKRYRSDGQGTTIQQVFDELEERYLKTNEAENTSSERSGLPFDRDCSDEKDESGAKGTDEPIYNLLHEVCLKGPPKYRAIPNQGGPIYFTLKRLKSNHPKATRICSKWEDEPVYSVVGEEFLKGAEGNYQPGEEPIYLTLEELCSETLKRARNDCEDGSESEGDIYEELKFGSTEETSPSEKPALSTSEKVYSKNLKKTNAESRC